MKLRPFISSQCAKTCCYFCHYYWGLNFVRSFRLYRFPQYMNMYFICITCIWHVSLRWRTGSTTLVLLWVEFIPIASVLCCVQEHCLALSVWGVPKSFYGTSWETSCHFFSFLFFLSSFLSFSFVFWNKMCIRWLIFLPCKFEKAQRAHFTVSLFGRRWDLLVVPPFFF